MIERDERGIPALTMLEFGNEDTATLVVAWRSGRNAHGRALKAGGDVTSSLRRYAMEALNKIDSTEGRRYDPSDEQDDECSYLDTDREELLDTALLDTIFKAASLSQAIDDDLRSHSIALYALVIGNDPDKLTAFVRKGNPVQLAKKSLVALFDQTLTRVEKPLLAFDTFYDVIIRPSQVHILHQKNFETLFKESEAVLAKTSEWAESLGKALPISAESVEWLSNRLRQTSVMRRRVQSILKSEYLHQLTDDVLREKMESRGLDPEKLMDGNQLILNKDTERDVLLLLNEDLWTGDFSGEQYAATRKARR
ncbi:Kiwa anti-phage protein KwaB-like domain-containing protein [Nocardia sp. alder85J]|uniref:Kiwa anti-phage protein KwaB-like domain-containing protein n=1 Tax=Nocardia sp. alder85J TaxID=2862949 RepID=UPI001CD4BE8B|nr:Kiwa anti-phage protein KwaB-like domain-containing protein [Nocardia sp. alder85J]MCX4097663.1 DUF4868 domain-containing protein [Nocardia sp. alder85J]